jgi:hypothetical protein
LTVLHTIAPPFAPLVSDARSVPVLAIDFEASCLPRHGRSYPIEVGIADDNGTARSWLIRPVAEWKGWTWTEEAEAMHGLTRQRLFDEGQLVTAVASELIEATAGCRLIADSELDDYWMRTLMTAASISPAPAIGHIVTLIGELDVRQEEVRSCVDLVDQRGFPRHRAGADARWLAALITALRRSAGDLRLS